MANGDVCLQSLNINIILWMKWVEGLEVAKLARQTVQVFRVQNRSPCSSPFISLSSRADVEYGTSKTAARIRDLSVLGPMSPYVPKSEIRTQGMLKDAHRTTPGGDFTSTKSENRSRERR
jgi:hypothetical protein